MAKNAWDFVCPMHERRYRPGVTVINGRIYVMGGEEGWDRCVLARRKTVHFDFDLIPLSSSWITQVPRHH